MFDKIRRLYDKDYRKAWEDALSALEVFRGSRVRLIATAPERVQETPELSKIQGVEIAPEIIAQVLFSDSSDRLHVAIDFYPTTPDPTIGVSYLVGDQVAAGGFNRVDDVERFIADMAESSASYLEGSIKKIEKKLGRILG